MLGKHLLISVFVTVLFSSCELIPRRFVQHERDSSEFHTPTPTPAKFPGGQDSIARYLQENIKYPDSALELGIRGKVVVRFVVRKDGTVGQIKVIQGIKDCPECSKEVIRVVRKMPKWKPAIDQGRAMTSYYNLPVRFDF